MSDFNFFEIYNKAAQKKRNRNAVLALVLVFVLAAISAAVIIAHAFKLSMLAIGYEIDSHKVVLNSVAFTEKLERYSVLNERLAELNAYNAVVDEVSAQLKASAFINTRLLEDITASMPEDTRFNSMSLTNDTINATGIGNSKIAIAELERNLSRLEYVESVFVGTITEQNQTEYNFSITIQLGEVAGYAENE